jgi:hypothetical protein
LTSVSPYLNVYSVTIANISQNSISVLINIGSSKQTVETLINSSMGGLFIDQNFAKNFEINYLDEPVKAYDMDGTENKRGMINACYDFNSQVVQVFKCSSSRFKDNSECLLLGIV